MVSKMSTVLENRLVTYTVLVIRISNYWCIMYWLVPVDSGNKVAEASVAQALTPLGLGGSRCKEAAVVVCGTTEGGGGKSGGSSEISIYNIPHAFGTKKMRLVSYRRRSHFHYQNHLTKDDW